MIAAPAAGAGIAAQPAAAGRHGRADAEILTDTLPPRLTPPVTLPPPADETRAPETVNGIAVGGVAIAGLGE